MDIYTNSHIEGTSCEALQSILYEEYSKDVSTPVMFYIHGRGKHPEKGINYLPEMEERYGIDVIMFHWESWENMISRPEENAINASEQLKICFQELDAFKLKEPELSAKRPLIFMSHSMGNIVFYALIQRELFTSEHKELFESMTFNAPDVPLRNHKEWMEKINYSSQLYVTMNDDDSILVGSKFIDYKDIKLFGGRRLGRAYSLILPKSYLASNIQYLDFSKLSIGGHQHFLENLGSSNNKLKMIFTDIFYHEGEFEARHSQSKFNGVYKFK